MSCGAEPPSIFTRSDTAPPADTATAPGSTAPGHRDGRAPLAPLTPRAQRPSAIVIPPHPPWPAQLLPDPTGSISRGEEGGSLVLAGQKRPLPPTFDATPSSAPVRATTPGSEPQHKRRNLHLRGHRLSKSVQLTPTGHPPSPLFFSSRSARPLLPARFSSSEAAARMLGKARGEDEGMRTVTLARGTFSGPSPSSSRPSSERSSMPPTTAPASRAGTGSDPLKLLGSVGIFELLEHDTRPTFIVDLGDLANYAPDASGLQILFANSALRSSPPTWELVVGKLPEHASDETTAHATQRFQSWLLSRVFQGDNMEANPLPIEHGGLIWSCYMLRQRMRVVSSAVKPHATATMTPASAPRVMAIPTTSSSGHGSGNSLAHSNLSPSLSEPQDYFGDTSPAGIEEGVSTSQLQSISGAAEWTVNDRGLFPKPAHISVQSVEEPVSFTTECVLRAQNAGDVDPFHREPQSSHDHDMGFFDWTRLPLSASLPSHILFARSVDWANTPLGPIEYWSTDLRAMCNLIM
jgi:hypothetical protein